MQAVLLKKMFCFYEWTADNFVCKRLPESFRKQETYGSAQYRGKPRHETSPKRTEDQCVGDRHDVHWQRGDNSLCNHQAHRYSNRPRSVCQHRGSQMIDCSRFGAYDQQDCESDRTDGCCGNTDPTIHWRVLTKWNYSRKSSAIVLLTPARSPLTFRPISLTLRAI